MPNAFVLNHLFDGGMYLPTSAFVKVFVGSDREKAGYFLHSPFMLTTAVRKQTVAGTDEGQAGNNLGESLEKRCAGRRQANCRSGILVCAIVSR